MTLTAQHRMEESLPWIVAPVFYLGGVAMTFLAVPIAIVMGFAMLLALPVVWSWNWTQRRRTRRHLDHVLTQGVVVRGGV